MGRAFCGAGALSLARRYRRLHCLSSGFFCEAPKARDARALEEAVRGGAGGEGERLSSLTVFRNWLRRDGTRVFCGAGALTLMGRYGRLRCLSSGFFCEAPKARDVRALEEAVRGGADGEGERLSSLTVFGNWLCCDGIRALWRGDTGSAGANAAIGFEKRRRGRRDVGRGIFQTRIRPERAFTREGLPPCGEKPRSNIKARFHA